MMPHKSIRLIAVLIICFGLAPLVQAVNPPPPGGYPGSNTAAGTQALQNLTTGVWNTALGFQALFSDTTGSSNTATGLRSLFSNVNGVNNTANGVLALAGNTSGFNNTAIGWSALRVNSTGAHNTAVGVNALVNNNATGNTALGLEALFANTSGASNNAFGRDALRSNTSGGANNAFGNRALFNNVIGNFNTAIGDGAGANITGSGNVCIGQGVGGIAGENNTTRIKNISNTPQATGIFVTMESVGGTKLGFTTSSGRYKEQIKPMEQASESIYRLAPVSFRYKKELDPQGTRQYGLIAEEVAKVDPDLVVNDEEGKPATLRFLSIQGMMLNELLKEHRRVEELQATVAEQQKEIKLLAAQLKEQAAQIQKVNAQLEANKAVPQVALNTP